ncbi:MAG: WXG100 family type VII secretion target [Candidatus Dormibacteria bacterium]
MATSDLLKVGKGELQAHAVQVRSCASQMDQTISQTQQRVQALLDSWLGLGANAFGDLFADWHRAAQTCHDALMAVATRLERSGQSYDEHDQAIAGAIRAQ